MFVSSAVGFGHDRIRAYRGERQRQFLFGQQVPPAEVDVIEAEVVRGEIEHAFAKEIRFETAWTPVGSGRRFVGRHHGDIGAIGWNAVRPGYELADIARPDRRRCTEIGADVHLHLGAHAELYPSLSRAISISHPTSRAWVTASRCSRRSSIPFHRPVQLARREGN